MIRFNAAWGQLEASTQVPQDVRAAVSKNRVLHLFRGGAYSSICGRFRDVSPGTHELEHVESNDITLCPYCYGRAQSELCNE